ncbi:MAG: hypothetical protein IKN03_00355 [Fibrobacter sp.]|nr:hypothetical protein [Fibrobacter sp.]
MKSLFHVKHPLLCVEFMLWKFLVGLQSTAQQCSPPPQFPCQLIRLQRTYWAHYRIWEKPQTYNNVINILKTCQFLFYGKNVENVPFFEKNGDFLSFAKFILHD